MFFTMYASMEKTTPLFQDRVEECGERLGDHYFNLNGKTYIVRKENEGHYVSTEVCRVEHYEDPVSGKEVMHYITVAKK